MSEYLLEMKNICKSFPGVKALQNVDFQLKAGEIHALLGENGAGKSTLIKVLGGIYHPEEGQILIDGKQVSITDVKSAQENGISIIHQELVQVPHMTVAENIFLGREPLGKFGVNYTQMSADSQKMLDRFDLGIDADSLIVNLSIAQQQMVEIVKAISFNCRILVMDEPTSSISDREVTALFEIMRNLAKQGVRHHLYFPQMSEAQRGVRPGHRAAGRLLRGHPGGGFHPQGRAHRHDGGPGAGPVLRPGPREVRGRGAQVREHFRRQAQPLPGQGRQL